MVAGGWLVHAPGNQQPYVAQCGGIGFWGYENGAAAGYVQATFKGFGIGTLEFGNCYTSGITKVYMNGDLIASAGSTQQSKVISFKYKSGDILKITEEQTAIIKINSFKLDACE